MKQESTDPDKILKDKLYDFEEQPLPTSWQHISNRMDQQAKRTSKLIQLWPYATAASISLLLAAAASVSLLLVMASLLMPSKQQPDSLTDKELIRKDPLITKNDTILHTLPSDPLKEINPLTAKTAFSQVIKKSSASKQTLTLPDGSTVTLNKNSEIKYAEDFTAARTVHIKGEVYFDVKHDEVHPFIIYSHLSKTQVLGTAFILRSYENEDYDELNVSRGKVSFEKLKGNPKKMIILAGNKAIISGVTARQEPITDVNYKAWQTEKIVFNDTELKEVFLTLENYYHISISTTSPDILNCRFTGVFEQSEINEVLQVLAVSFNLSYNEDSKNYILSGKGCK